MKRFIASITLVLSFFAISAGEGHKCQTSPQICINKMAENAATQGWMGVELDHSGTYATVKAVIPNSPAARAGIQVGDEIRSVQGVSTKEKKDELLENTFNAMHPGDTIVAVVGNDKGKERKVEILLVRMPPAIAENMMGKHMMTHVQPADIN